MVLWDKDESQADCVDDKVDGVVVRVEAGEEEQEDGHDGEKCSRRCVLDSVIDLLPMREPPDAIRFNGRQPGRRLDPVENVERDHVVHDVSRGPDLSMKEIKHCKDQIIQTNGLFPYNDTAEQDRYKTTFRLCSVTQPSG